MPSPSDLASPESSECQPVHSPFLLKAPFNKRTKEFEIRERRRAGGLSLPAHGFNCK
jgi:hypothetical protein